MEEFTILFVGYVGDEAETQQSPLMREISSSKVAFVPRVGDQVQVAFGIGFDPWRVISVRQIINNDGPAGVIVGLSRIDH